MPANEGSPRAARQPDPSGGGPEATFGAESVVKAGDRASIFARWGIFDLIATHLQLHLPLS
jgi:hypothetical protein